MRIQVTEKLRSSTFTLAINTAIFAVDDLMGAVMALSSKAPNGQLVIKSVSLLDKASQNSEMVIVFITDSGVSAGSNNNPVSIPDSTFRSVARGAVPISATDYRSLASNSVAFKNNLNIVLSSSTGFSPGVFVICKGTPTYASATDLILTINYYVE